MQSQDNSYSAESAQSYEIKRAAGDNSERAIYLVGGIVGFLIAAAGFLLCIQFDVGQPGLTIMSTMPATMGTLALIQYFSKGSRLNSILSDVQGLTFRYANRQQLVTWDQMGLVERTSSGMSQKPIINLYDRNGKHLATIDNGFEHFETVAKWLADRVKSAAGEAMVGMLKLNRHRRVGLGALIFGLVLLAVVVGLGYEAYYSNRGEKLLSTSAVAGQAEIMELVIAPNGRTKRLYYEVLHEDQRGPQENVEIDEFTWHLLQGQNTVPVKYVPSDLSVSELISGQVKEKNFTDTLAGKITLLSIGSAFGLGLLVCGILMRKGWILETDPVTKKNKFYRLPAAS